MRQKTRDSAHYYLELLVMIVIFLVFFGIGLFLLSSTGRVTIPVTHASVITTPHSGASWVQLATANGGHSYRAGDTFDIIVTADSGTRDINAYNFILRHPGLAVVAVKSLVAGIDVVSSRETSSVMLSATRVPSIMDPMVLKNTPILDITAHATSSGDYRIELVDKEAKGVTAFVDRAGVSFIPSLDGPLMLHID